MSDCHPNSVNLIQCPSVLQLLAVSSINSRGFMTLGYCRDCGEKLDPGKTCSACAGSLNEDPDKPTSPTSEGSDPELDAFLNFNRDEFNYPSGVLFQLKNYWHYSLVFYFSFISALLLWALIAIPTYGLALMLGLEPGKGDMTIVEMFFFGLLAIEFFVVYIVGTEKLPILKDCYKDEEILSLAAFKIPTSKYTSYAAWCFNIPLIGLWVYLLWELAELYGIAWLEKGSVVIVLLGYYLFSGLYYQFVLRN